MIRSARGEFGGGLNAVTGESGAGKSVLMAALGMALGDRADQGLVRAGEGRALVSATFSTFEDAAQQLQSLGLADAELLVLTRELGVGGRSAARLNGALVPAAVLRELGERLVDRHGQGAAGRWLRESEQRSALDWFQGDSGGLRERVAALWGQYRDLGLELDGLRRRGRTEQAELERAEADMQELTAAGLRPGEGEALRAEREQLIHLSRLREAARGLKEAVAGSEQGSGAADSLAAQLQSSRPLSGVDPDLDGLRGEAEEALAILQDLGPQLGSYLDHLPLDQSRLEQVEERLALLERVARRHGGTVEAALTRLEEARTLVRGSGSLELDLRQLSRRREELGSELGAACAELTRLRRAAAERLARDVTQDLRQMLMPASEFAIELGAEPDPEGVPAPDGGRLRASAEGWDRVRFLLSANRGDEVRPLAEAASGGELARVALALLARLSHRSGVGTVVFDEIDQGLGGEAANRVGELLLEVSRRRQVICVTHLAGIAARAQSHLRVTKVEESGRPASSLERLEGEPRVEELARLLAGEATPQAARNHAAELLAAVGGR